MSAGFAARAEPAAPTVPSPAPAPATAATPGPAPAPAPAVVTANASVGSAPAKPATPPTGPQLTPGPVMTPADPWAEAMSAFATADNADAHAGGVVFVGSSSIRLWSDLEKRYSSYAAVNRGFGGSTLADCVKYMDRLVLPHKPRLVVVYAGDNDLAGGRTPDQVLLDFVELTSRIQERLPKTQIVYVSIKPSPARIDMLGRVRDTNTRIKNYVGTKPYLRYIDVFTPMLDAKGKPRPELFSADSLHLNEQGYALWHSLISPVLPTEEQLAMAKPVEPKDVPLMAKEAGVPADPSPVARAAAAAASEPAPKVEEPPKPATPEAAAERKAVTSAPSDAKPAAAPGATVSAPATTARGDAAAPAKPAATVPVAPTDVTPLPKAPDAASTMRANVKLPDAAPTVPAAPPFAPATAAVEAPQPAATDAATAPPVETKDAPLVDRTASEVARLPPPPHTVRANVKPANAPPSAEAVGPVAPAPSKDESGDAPAPVSGPVAP